MRQLVAQNRADQNLLIYYTHVHTASYNKDPAIDGTQLSAHEIYNTLCGLMNAV